ncbi:MAG TPA: Zn-dependent alcohol dehydrogenase [Acidimicrobiales bacterium]|nr:Zn-dependent alcohol dehydrogenase [Acidimicrobiales bacterium]
MRAAVCTVIGTGTVEIIDDVSIGELRAGEVRIRMHAAGICHSDLSAIDGTLPQMAPVIPGHEGAGEVLEIGPGVTSCQVGDHVIVAWNPPCGSCPACRRGEPNLCTAIFFSLAAAKRYLRADGSGLYGFAGMGTWVEESVLPEQGVVVIPDDVPYEIGALIGCGVTTGVGAAINTAKVRPGSSVVVYGCGGVGISAIQGARLAGAAEIVGVDTVPSKLTDAQRFGATHGVHPDELAAVQGAITGGEGFDYAFECVGSPSTYRAAWDATRRGGTTVIVGAGSSATILELNGFELFFSEKKLLGSFYGSADVRTEFHRLIRLWRAGRIDLEGMISTRLPLEEVGAGITALQKGEIIRQIVTF